MYKMHYKLLKVDDMGKPIETFYDDILEFEGEYTVNKEDSMKIIEIFRKVLPNYDEVIKDNHYAIYRKRIEENNQIDMKSIPIDKRPNIGTQDMDKYINGGLTVESLEVNGALVYIPYGIYCDIFRAIEVGMYLMQREIDNKKESKQKVVSDMINDQLTLDMKKYPEAIGLEMVESVECQFDNAIKNTREKLDILQNIYPMINEV